MQYIKGFLKSLVLSQTQLQLPLVTCTVLSPCLPPTPTPTSPSASAASPVLTRLLTPTANSKTTGQFHSVKGTVVETIGNLTGLESWSKSGRDEHAQGEAEYNAAQAKGYAEGTIDRLGGKKDAVVGAISGDRQQETAGERSASVVE